MKRSFTKFLINNISEKRYLKNINRVNFNRKNTGSNNILDDEQIKERMNEINRYQTEYRHRNLTTLKSYMSELRAIQFFGILLPASLIGATIGNFLLPYKRIKTKEYEAYQKESTVLSEEEGQITNLVDKYYYNTNYLLFDPIFLDSEHNTYAYSLPNDLEYRISNGIDMAIANFELGKKGKLIFNNVEIGKYIDESDYDFSKSTDIDSKYKNLFDDVYELIKSEGNLDENQLEALEKIYNSEDKKIIIEIIKTVNIGDKKVEIVKTRLFSRMLLLFIIAMYISMEIIIYKKLNFNEGYDINYSDGLLSITAGKSITDKYDFLRQSIKYKEAFIRAEVDRISRAIDLANEYIEEQDREEIFTPFERKLKK